MTIRILCIVAALIAAVWISYKIELSRGWTAFFTLLVSAAMGFLATIVPVVTPVRTGYRPDCYVSVYNGESDPLVFSVSDTDYDCANRIDLRDSNIFTQHKLLEEAFDYPYYDEVGYESSAPVILLVGVTGGICIKEI